MKTTDYHCGVIDAFNEMVACGVKRLALSHPFATAEERAQVLPFEKRSQRSIIRCIIWKTGC